MVFISEECVFHHAITDKREARMPLCFGSAFRKTCNLTIWTSGAPRKAFQEHKPKVNIFRCLGLWPGYYIIRCRSPAPTKRRIKVPTEKEDNTTLACAGPKSSHHLWQRWWGRDCRSPEFVCWTWSPARTTEMTSQRMPQWKRSLIKFLLFFLYPLLHNLYSCDLLFLSKHSSVHWGVKKRKRLEWTQHFRQLVFSWSFPSYGFTYKWSFHLAYVHKFRTDSEQVRHGESSVVSFLLFFLFRFPLRVWEQESERAFPV